MAKYKTISMEDIENLATKAATGDASALSELGRLNSKYGRAANQRMRELEKREMKTGAYRRAVDETGGKGRFSQAKTGDPETLLRSLEKIVKFMNYQTGTVSGEMKRRENILKGLERENYNVGTDRKAFLDFLDSDAWNEFKSMFGSKDAMKQISDAMERGANITDLLDAYNDFTNKESEAEDLLQVWDGWYSQ